MKKGGTGGGRTQSGLRFEEKADFLALIGSKKGYTVKGHEIFFQGKKVAASYKKGELYKYLAKQGIDDKKILSARLLPDDAIFVIKDKMVYILEIKFQEVSGSTDEKLQTGDFKIKQYKKLLFSLGLSVEFIFILNDWFKQARYKDVLDYIKSTPGCSYYFEVLPLGKIGLPTPS